MLQEITSEKKAIQHLVDNMVEGWNHHDAKLYADPFAEDAEFTTVFGNVNYGKKTIEDAHAFIFSTVFKESHITISETRIKFIKPDVASVEIRWNMTGARLSDGSPWKERTGIMYCTVVCKNEKWKIALAHNSELAELPAGFILPPLPSS